MDKKDNTTSKKESDNSKADNASIDLFNSPNKVNEGSNKTSNDEFGEEEFNKKKREILPNKKRKRIEIKNRKMREYLFRRKIARHFFNCFLIKRLNERLKKARLFFYLNKFPIEFVIKASKKSNNNILEMTLEEIFENKELYSQNYKVNFGFNHNLAIIKTLKTKEYKENMEDIKLNEILGMTFSQIFLEYLYFEEYLTKINQEKSKIKDNSYLENYIYYSKKFIENYI